MEIFLPSLINLLSLRSSVGEQSVAGTVSVVSVLLPRQVPDTHSLSRVQELQGAQPWGCLSWQLTWRNNRAIVRNDKGGIASILSRDVRDN